MAFSEILLHVGNLGKFQILLFILILLITTLMNVHNLVDNFTSATPAHRCYIHLLDNTTFVTNTSVNLTTEALLRVSIPMGPNYKPEQCRRFRQTQWQLLDSNMSITNISELETEPCLDGWIYDQSIFTSTIVTQWDLVCDKKSFKSLSQSIFFTGQMMGTPISGYFADRFGRKPVLLCFSLLFGLFGTCSLFASTFPVYCMIRFIMAISLGTVTSNNIILLIEWIPTKARTQMMTALSMSMSTGQILLAGVTYAFRDWHIVQLAISLPYLAYFLLLWWFSESARWLIVTGKLDKALKELKKVARFNGKNDAAENLTIELLKSTMQEELASCTHSSKLKELIASSTMRKIICCFCFMRFTAIVFLFGLLMDLHSLGSDIFLTQALFGAIDFPAKYVAFFIMKYLSRRTSIAFLLIFAGSFMLVNVFVPQAMVFLRVGIALVGKGFMAMYLTISMTYGMELTPTRSRSVIQGLFIFTSSVAGIVSSLLLIIRLHVASLPMIIYGCLAITASISVYFLPETRNLPLPDTILDVKRRYDRNPSYKEPRSNDLSEHTES